MRRVFPALAALTLLIALALPAGAQAQGPAGGKALTDVYQRLLTAVAKKDTVALKRLLAPTYLYVPPTGDTVLTRDERLKALATDTAGPQSFALKNCRTQVYGSAAVAHCRFTATQRVTGADSTRETISTAVFVRSGGRWQIVATHPSFVTR